MASGREIPIIDCDLAGSLHAPTILDQLRKHSFVVLRRFGNNPKPLDALMACEGYDRFRDDLGRCLVSLHVDPLETSHAERTLPGEFHTDYSQHPVPPAWVAINCTATDPRHPNYGRNQIAHIRDVLRTVQKLDQELFARLSTCSFPMLVRGKTFESPLLSRLPNGEIIVRYHPGYIVRNNLLSQHYYKGLSIDRWLHHIAMDQCYDFCLDEDDCLLASNYVCLHRRDTATISFVDGLNSIVSRKIVSWRYSRSVPNRLPNFSGGTSTN